jgi:hypothetical protein
MNEITLRGYPKVVYIRNEDIPEIETIPDTLKPKLVNNEQARPILLSGGRLYTFNMYFLYWFEKVDLEALDQKVMESTYTDDDFTYVAITMYQRTHCRDCREEYDTLALVTVLSSARQNRLADILRADRLERYSGLPFIQCPNCGADLRPSGVVQIMD